MADNPNPPSDDAAGENARRSSDEIRLLVTDAARRLVDELSSIDRRCTELNDAAGRAAVAAAMDRCLATLAATELWGRDNEVPSSQLWRIAGPLLERGHLQLRAKQKPLGYAGDFEMMTDFRDRRVRGASPLARWFDDYFQAQTAVDAVRSRIALAASTIVEQCSTSTHEEFRVVSIGSGPAIDLEEAARAVPSPARGRLRFTLMDLDEQGLAAARSRLSAVVDDRQIDPRRENLFRLTRLRGGTAVPREVDLVICSGLFDYLADDVATDHLALYRKALRRGGRLMAGNFAPHNPSRAYMEWVGNWYLKYRTSDDLLRLADAAGIPPKCRRITAESTGCDLFLFAEGT